MSALQSINEKNHNESCYNQFFSCIA